MRYWQHELNVIGNTIMHNGHHGYTHNPNESKKQALHKNSLSIYTSGTGIAHPAPSKFGQYHFLIIDKIHFHELQSKHIVNTYVQTESSW